MSYLFWLQVVLIRTQPEKTCPTKNVVFIGVSGFVVLMQSYHQPEDFIQLGHRMMIVRVPDEAVSPEDSKTAPPKDAGHDR